MAGIVLTGGLNPATACSSLRGHGHSGAVGAGRQLSGRPQKFTISPPRPTRRCGKDQTHPRHRDQTCERQKSSNHSDALPLLSIRRWKTPVYQPVAPSKKSRANSTFPPTPSSNSPQRESRSVHRASHLAAMKRRSRTPTFIPMATPLPEAKVRRQTWPHARASCSSATAPMKSSSSSATLLSPAAEVVVSQCCFAVYPIVTALFGAKLITVPAKNYGHDLDAMLAAITPRTRAHLRRQSQQPHRHGCFARPS